MVACNRCPGCGLRMGTRKEPDGLYRCRKCKTVIRVERRGPDSVITAKPAGAAEGRDLMTIPRV